MRKSQHHEQQPDNVFEGTGQGRHHERQPRKVFKDPSKLGLDVMGLSRATFAYGRPHHEHQPRNIFLRFLRAPTGWHNEHWQGNV